MTINQMRKISIAIPSLSDEEWLAVREPLLGGWLTQGPKVFQFEREFMSTHKVDYAFAVTSCTTGLHLALAALGVGPGDEVIVPAFTWIATANVVLYCGATPIFCDVDKTTFNIKIEDIPSKITERTKAIIPVHLFGLCADIDAIRSVIPNSVKILEDAACAAGAWYKNRSAGSLGDIASFSFHPRKSITTGEGGMVTTNDKDLACLVGTMRNHGAEIPEEVRLHSAKPYLLPDFKILGFNYRMTDLQAAIGIVQLKKLTSFIKERQIWADYYKRNLSDISWIIPQAVPNYCTQHAWQAFVCCINPKKAPLPRNEIMDILQQKGISTRPGTHAVHALSFYREKYHIDFDDFPEAGYCAKNTIAIPLHNKMVQEDFDYVIDVLKSI
ncbi:MAG: DegT/DnrJ/EryC1/StrS family aminotransferase [Coxiellaceae bacterium]|jgi:dTDP-4-amino-4,6-dideoxygalactose transaminase|nr:DegT/DnrJ/EryC1/StrS family aminotransferase [Coxiellaceae bacterium]